jgi:hypothetical protein
MFIDLQMTNEQNRSAMKNKVWLSALLLVLFHKPATAGVVSSITADNLIDRCRSADADLKKLNSDDLSDWLSCVSYIEGVMDGYAVGVVTTSGERKMACNIPNSVTVKEIALILLRYAKDNPAELHLPASVVIIKAVDKSFPCK